MKKIFKKSLLVMFLSFFVFSTFFVATAFAEDTLIEQVPDGAPDCTRNDDGSIKIGKWKKYCGDYELNDFLKVGITVSKIIIGVSGSLSLLMLVIGGVMYVISSGNQEMVNKGNSYIKNALIGLIVVLCSYLIVNFVMGALGVSGAWSTSNWFS